MKSLSILTISIFLLSGCGTTPTKQIYAFADSAAKLTESTGDLVDRVNAETLDQKLLVEKNKHAALPNLVTNFTDQDLSKIVITFSPADKKNLALIQSTNVLNQYAKNLKALAGAGDQASLNQANIGLNTSLVNMNKELAKLNLNQISKEKLGVIAASVDAYLTKSVESKRQKMLKAIITEGQTEINDYVAAIVAELDRANFDSWLASSRKTKLLDKIDDYKVRVKNGYYQGKGSDHLTALKDLWAANNSVSNAKKEADLLKKALKQLAKSHGEVANAVKSKKIDLAAVIAASGELNAARKRYEAVKEKITTCEALAIDPNNEIVCKK